jgi:hypothetical protein
VAGLAGTVESAAAHSPERNATFTVLVWNYAQVDAKRLADAEKIAAEIYSKLGVETRWVDIDSASDEAAVLNPTSLSEMQLLILPSAMADRSYNCAVWQWVLRRASVLTDDWCMRSIARSPRLPKHNRWHRRGLSPQL